MCYGWDGMIFRSEDFAGRTEHSVVLEERRTRLIGALEERLEELGLLEPEENLDPTHIFAPQVEVVPIIAHHFHEPGLRPFPLLLVCPPHQINVRSKISIYR